MMKKLLLFTLLLLGSVGVGWAQSAYSAHYDFSQTSVGDYQSITVNENVSFTVNLTNGGYNNAWGENELKVCLANFTFNGNDPKVFAFNNIEVSKDWDDGHDYPAWRQTPASDDNGLAPVGIKNMTEQTNVFSVLNLRAGEIVKVKTADHSYAFNEGKAVKDRFIVEHSPNAYNNTPWANPNADVPLSITTQEFVMTADGNLDLKVAGFVKILEIDIVSNYVNFEKSTVKAGDDISVSLPNRRTGGNEDFTNEVDEWGWSRWDNNSNQSVKLTGTPNTQNGVNPTSVTNLREYWSDSPHYTGSDGHLIWNVTTGLTAGAYHVEVYATSHKNVNGGNSFQNGDESIAFVYARANGNEQKASIPAYNSGTLNASNEPFVRGFDVTVGSDGQLELGLGLNKGGYTNWHCIQIKSLTKIGSGSSGKYAMEEPVVLYYGDLTPGTVTTTKNSSGNWDISITGVNGKEHPDGKWWGGSVIVMLDETMHTVTIPYNVNKDGYADFASWNFWQNPLYVGRAAQQRYESLMSHDIAEGSFELVLENSNPSSREPLYEYNGKMNGQNAYFHPETAGLIIETNGTQQYGILNENAGPEPDGLRYLGLQNGGSLTIPDLDEGDEVWVYFDHFGASSTLGHDDSSIGMYVTNATDALGKIIENEVITAGGATWGPSFYNSNKEAKIYVGAMHFYSTGGDMKFTPSFFTNFNILKICYIRIVKHNPQNIISKTNSVLHYNSGYELLTTQDAAGNYTNSTATWRLHECGRGQSNQRWEVREASGNLSAYEINQKINASYHQLTDGIGEYDGNPGHANNIWFRYTSKNEPTFGSFLLRGMDFDFNNKYCFDYADRVIAVGFRQTMNYPYTWDFTDILNSETGNSQAEYDLSAAKFRPVGGVQPVGGIYSDTQQYDGSTIWMNDTTSVWVKYNDVISLQNARTTNENNRTLSSGTQLFASDTYIEEAAGLGWATINMDVGFNGSIQILNEGVKIQTYNGWETRLFVPGANKTGRIYVRGKKLNDGKGFVAKAYKNANMGPNTFKNTPDTRVELTPLFDEGQTQTVFHYEGNFSTYIEGQQDFGDARHYDDVMTAVAGRPGLEMEERLGSDRSVTNGTILYDEAGYNSRIVSRTEHTYEYDDDGNPIKEYDVTVIESDDNVYLNDEDTHDINKALFDRNVSFCSTIDGNDITDFVYTNFIDTKGSGKANGRYLQLTLPESDYGFDVTVVARSQSSRQINVFAGNSWGSESSALATMVVQSNLSAKTLVAPAGTTSLLIGSDNSGIEIYAIYVKEKKTINASDPVDWAGYVDVAATDGGVTLYLNDIIIEKMAYSTDVKTLNSIGWASESRNHFIDHRLTEYFTQDPVKAYVATAPVKQNGSKYINAITLTELTKPMELTTGDGTPSEETHKGCVMHNTAGKGVDGGVYLFVPDIHDYLDNDYITNANFKGDACTNGCPISTGAVSYANYSADKINSMSGNMMIANLNGNTVPYSGTSAEYTNYVLSNNFTDGEGVYHQNDPTERFVRVASGGATGNPNTAYLQLLTSDVKPEGYQGESNIIILFDGENEGTDPDGIDEFTFSSNGTQNACGSSDIDAYYTLSGQKINKPTKPGVYVKNGKKVYVK